MNSLQLYLSALLSSIPSFTLYHFGINTICCLLLCNCNICIWHCKTLKALINSPVRSKKELLPLDYRSENSSREIIWFAQGYKTRQFQNMFISKVCTGSANPYLLIYIQTPLLPRMKYKTGLTVSMSVRNYTFDISYMLLLYLTSFILCPLFNLNKSLEASYKR